MSIYKTCNICKEEKLIDLKKHILQKARFEVWQKFLGCKEQTPHFNHYIKNTRQNNSKLYARKWK